MSELSRNNWIYIIDENFKIIYSNDEIKNNISNIKLGEHCYEMICQESQQCNKCPLREENQRKTVLFDRLHNEWMNVNASPIDWPNVGKCFLIFCNGVEDEEQNFYNNFAGQSEYSELLELNYLEDKYDIIYCSGSERTTKSYSIYESVRSVAEKNLYEEDHARFNKFWRLDRIGKKGLPKEILKPRHAEFRKLNEDGGYSWVQQVMIPTKQTTSDSIFVMVFYNVIDVQSDLLRQYNDNLESGLFNRQKFFENVEEFINKIMFDDQCMLAIDIEKFKLFNEWYGRDAGNQLLMSVSKCLKEFQSNGQGIAGYFGDDDFVFFMEYQEDLIAEVCDKVSEQMKKHSGKMNLLPSFGVYKVTDKKEAVYRMYDRAKLAASTVKGNYVSRMKVFDLKMLEALESELLLLSDIQKAFEHKEFTFVLQPKCHMKTGKIEGAEALARWYNEEKGMVSPGIFIPFLEKSGLVSELDTYIWEEVCRWQRSMIDRGRRTVPVSVNVSRMDICSVDVPAYFDRLVHKYDLDPKFIEIEITESAYAEDIEIINRIVMELKDLGFRVLMDDFGSAYSSLNMLKDIQIDEIKVDMRFLYWNGENASKGADILETVCHMAHILGLDIIAEGVETNEQKDMLLKTGCHRGQGYYFYRPLAIEDFEEVIKDGCMIGEEMKEDATELFYLKDLLNKNMLSQNMLSQMLGAVAFYDVHDQEIHVVRYNEQYAQLIEDKEELSQTKVNFGEQLYIDEYDQIFEMFKKAQVNRQEGAEMDVRRRKNDGTDMWIHLRVFFLYQKEGHSFYYSTASDVTEVHQNNAALNFLNNDMPGGYYRHQNNEDCDFTHISQRFLDIFGYTREEIKEYFDDKFMNMIHPDDRAKARYSMSAMEQTGGNYSQPCRMRSKSGYIFVIDQSRLVKYEEYEVFQGIIICNLDHYMWLNEDVNTTEDHGLTTTLMPCGVFRSEADGDHQFAYVSNSLLHMLGYSREEFENKFKNKTDNFVYKDDYEHVTKQVSEQIKQSIFTACEHRIEMADGTLRWFYSRGRLSTDENGKRWFYTCITDYDYLMEKYQIQEWQNIKYQSLLEIPGVLVYDYDPKSDQLTVEMAMEEGTKETIVAKDYLSKIYEHGLIHKDCIDKQKELLEEASVTALSGITEFKARFIEDSEFNWYRFHYISLADEQGKVYRIVGRGENINEEKSNVEIWQQRAMKDSLTGLMNYESAKEIISNMIEKKRPGVLMVIDVDNFKMVNDTQGHLMGDKLLIEIAKVLKTVFRKEDIVARFGGDEFLVYISGTVSRGLVIKKCQEFLEKISKINLYADLHVQCSIGVTMDCDTDSFEEFFEQADKALYKSKRYGKNTFTFYDENDF